MSDYLDEEEQLARLKSWWDENGTFLLVSVVVAVAAIVGWNWYGGYSENQRQAQTALLMTYQEATDAERDAAAAAIEAEFPGGAAHSFVLFERAQAAIEAGDFEVARDSLSTVVDIGKDDLLVDLARIRLAKVLRQLDLSDEALNVLAAVRNEGYRALALETQGDIHASNGDIEQAHLAYQAAVASLPAGDTRPLLEMKLENAKPFAGQYVQMTDQLTEALKEAATSLDVQLPDVEAPAAEDEARPEESSR
ncbi:MAG: tetratricopeptide repeat protein [Pseudomonadales bacterium]